jgi:hypothetical protein
MEKQGNVAAKAVAKAVAAVGAAKVAAAAAAGEAKAAAAAPKNTHSPTAVQATKIFPKNAKIQVSKGPAQIQSQTDKRQNSKNNRQRNQDLQKTGYVTRVYNQHHYNPKTYQKRRNHFYHSYNPPQYTYQTYKHFGMWDARTMAMQGERRNPNYMPQGIDADLALSSEVVDKLSPNIPKMTIATGGTQGNYYKYGNWIKKLATCLECEVLTSPGSWLNIMALEQGKVDAAFGQSDALALALSKFPELQHKLKVFGNTHVEYVHLIVNRDSA